MLPCLSLDLIQPYSVIKWAKQLMDILKWECQFLSGLVFVWDGAAVSQCWTAGQQTEWLSD